MCDTFFIIIFCTMAFSSWKITRENVISTLQIAGGRLESRLIVCKFVPRGDSEPLTTILNEIAKKKYDYWVLKDEFKLKTNN